LCGDQVGVIMAKSRSKARRAGGRSSSPLTRRQLKRARHQAIARGQRDVAPSTPAAPATLKHRQPAATAAIEPQPHDLPLASEASSESAPVQTTERPALTAPLAPATEAALPESALLAAAAEPEPLSASPAAPLSNTAEETALAEQPEARGADEHAEMAPQPDPPPRKFPTLAAMVTNTPPHGAAIDVPTRDQLRAADAPAGDARSGAADPQDLDAVTEATLPALNAAWRMPPSIEFERPARPAAAALRPVARENTNANATGQRRAQRPGISPLPTTDPVLPLAGVQVAVAVCGALSGVTLLIAGQSTGWWPLSLAAIAGVGGWLASTFATRTPARPRRAGWALVASQLLVLAWGLALVGPRDSLLVVAALIVLSALRLCGRGDAAVAAVFASALYAVAVVLAIGDIIRPTLVFDAPSGAVFDGVVSCLGLLLLLRQALRLHALAAKTAALAAARGFELETVRDRTTQLRQQVEADAERLRMALRDAQTDAPASDITASGALSPLAAEISITSARLQALRRDREQRRQLDRGIARLVRALERAWLGLPWEWPSPSDTKLDDVVALLRSPNPRETARAHLDDSSGLLPIPTLDSAHMPAPPWLPPAPHPLAPLAEPQSLWSSGELRAAIRDGSWPPQQPGLPWDQWDEWRGWDPAREE
jgi:hypothetical protein